MEMANPDETLNVPKAKKSRFKRKMLKTKLGGINADNSQEIPTGNSTTDVALAPQIADYSKNGQLTAVENTSMVCEDQTDLVKLTDRMRWLQWLMISL
ncbi:hypothetical protein REPUB_Repub19eG0069600 [Reevesia pubescens]